MGTRTQVVLAAIVMASGVGRAAPKPCGDIGSGPPLIEHFEYPAAQRPGHLVRDLAKELAIRGSHDDEETTPTPEPVKLVSLERGLTIVWHRSWDGPTLTLVRKVDAGHCVINTWRFTLEPPMQAEVMLRGQFQSADRLFLVLKVEGDANEPGNDGGPINHWVVLGSDGKRMWIARDGDVNERGDKERLRLVPTGDTVELTIDKKGKKRLRLDAARERFVK